MDFYILLASFLLIALIYSSVGFAGGSSYLAILSLSMFGLAFPVIRSTALFCNIIVATGGVAVFYREGKLSLRECWPYMVTSVPMAYVGGFWPIKEGTFFVLLGLTLVVTPFFLWFQPGERTQEAEVNTKSLLQKSALGGAIGFLSGLVGIGGGIFLSPALHLLRWSEPKRISATASLFILVNSIGGLAGQFKRGIPEFRIEFLFPLLAAVLVGGQIGSRLGARTFNALYIRRITAVLIFVAGANILKDHL
ncbi:MAG TPA: sulfite exporter TauE/SafE family protein [Cyclobacteriaceae bacterium]|nr:sulfite exporter TauE/SafE family protein [Cyclobacteriaceae bacterium]